MRITWGDFKREVEAQGVTDEMLIDWIDITGFDRPSATISDSAVPGEPPEVIIQ